MKEKFQGRSEGLGIDEMWEEMKQAVVEAAEVTIRTKPGRRTQREEWWWSEEVRQALREEGSQEVEKIRTGGRQGGI